MLATSYYGFYAYENLFFNSKLLPNPQRNIKTSSTLRYQSKLKIVIGNMAQIMTSNFTQILLRLRTSGIMIMIISK